MPTAHFRLIEAISAIEGRLCGSADEGEDPAVVAIRSGVIGLPPETVVVCVSLTVEGSASSEVGGAGIEVNVNPSIRLTLASGFGRVLCGKSASRDASRRLGNKVGVRTYSWMFSWRNLDGELGSVKMIFSCLAMLPSDVRNEDIYRCPREQDQDLPSRARAIGVER
jgi:hypothetical protein